jgi:hypothetical protein
MSLYPLGLQNNLYPLGLNPGAISFVMRFLPCVTSTDLGATIGADDMGASLAVMALSAGVSVQDLAATISVDSGSCA